MKDSDPLAIASGRGVGRLVGPALLAPEELYERTAVLVAWSRIVRSSGYLLQGGRSTALFTVLSEVLLSSAAARWLPSW